MVTHPGVAVSAATQSISPVFIAYELRRHDLAFIFHHLSRCDLDDLTRRLEHYGEAIGLSVVEHVIVEVRAHYTSIAYFKCQHTFDLFNNYLVDVVTT